MSDQQADGLSVLIPVYNQGSVIEQALVAWSGLLEKLGRPFEIVLINDGSTDATRNLTESLTKRLKNLVVIDHPERRGYGASLKEGLAIVRHPLLFYTGLEAAYPPSDLRKLLQRLEEVDPESGLKLDMVNGYRSGTPVAGWRKWRGRIWRGFQRAALGLPNSGPRGWLGTSAHRYGLLIRALFGVRIGDVDSRFKLFRKSIFDRIPIQSEGDFVHAEILAKANFLGCVMDELPIGEKPGPFRGHPEPPSPAPRGREMRRVFFQPDFGPSTIAKLPTQTATNTFVV